MLTNRIFLVCGVAFLTAGCTLQVPESVSSRVLSQALPTSSLASAPLDSGFANNEVDNLLTITRVSAWPAVVASGSSSVLAVDYEDALGRPVGVSWDCNAGVLLSDRGAKTVWYPPKAPGAVCDCEVTVKSRSGSVKARVRLMVEGNRSATESVQGHSFGAYVK